VRGFPLMLLAAAVVAAAPACAAPGTDIRQLPDVCWRTGRQHV